MFTAKSLELAEDGNGSQNSGTTSFTVMTIHDIEELEVGYHNIQDEIVANVNVKNGESNTKNTSLKKKYCTVIYTRSWRS